MSVSDDAEKLWYYIKTKDLDEVTKFLGKKTTSEMKAICEYEVNTIVWPREQYHRDSFSCLHYGAKKGRANILEEMFVLQGVTEENDAKSLGVNLPTSVLGWTPLHYAAYGNSFRTVKMLIKYGANVNTEAKDGATPMHIAVCKCSKKAIVGLVKAGASVNVSDQAGNTPLHLCMFALRMGSCTEQDCKEMIEYLLSNGCNPLGTDRNGDLTLHLGLRNNVQSKTVGILASAVKHYHPDTINCKNSSGIAPIHFCTNEEQVKLLLKYGAKINLQTDVEKDTLLHRCTPDFNMVKIVVNNGGDLMVRNVHGQIPLQAAVSQDCPNLEVIKIMSSEYKYVTSADNQGNTVLHTVCASKYKSVMVKDDQEEITEKHLGKDEDPVLDFLITERGVNVDEKNNLGQTGLHIALQNRNFQKATVLLAHGANIDLVDNKNITPRNINPFWTRKALADLDFSDLESMSSVNTYNTRKSDVSSIATKEPTTSNSMTKAAILSSASKTVNNIEKHKNPSGNKETMLTREMTILKDEVEDVKNFLEQFSQEGESNSSRSSKVSSTSSFVTEPNSLDRQLTILHEEVNDLNKILQEVSS